MANNPPLEKNSDRRAVRRYDLSVPIEVRTSLELPGILKGTTRDLSSRGAYFVADREFSPGSELIFTLTLPVGMAQTSGVLVKGRGRIVRADTRIEEGETRFGVGVTIETYDLVRVEPSEA